MSVASGNPITVIFRLSTPLTQGSGAIAFTTNAVAVPLGTAGTENISPKKRDRISEP